MALIIRGGTVAKWLLSPSTWPRSLVSRILFELFLPDRRPTSRPCTHFSWPSYRGRWECNFSPSYCCSSRALSTACTPLFFLVSLAAFWTMCVRDYGHRLVLSPFQFSASLLSWDTVYTADGIILYVLLVTPAAVATLAGAAALLAGTFAGLLVLLNPASLAVIVIWLACLLSRLDWKKVALFTGIFALPSNLVCRPWIVRNERRIGAFTLKTNLGTVLNSSNNDCAQASLASNLNSSCFQQHHPTSVREAQLLSRMGEVKYDASRKDKALSWIRNNPERFARLTAQRVVQFWFPERSGGAFNVLLWPVTALSLPGLILIADSDDGDQSFRSDADQSGAKRRRALSV